MSKFVYVHCPPSGRFPGFVKYFLRVPQLLCSFPAAQASKGNELSENCLQNLRNDLMAESVSKNA